MQASEARHSSTQGGRHDDPASRYRGVDRPPARRSNATCTAIEAVDVAVITRPAIVRLIDKHPAVGAKLLVKLTQLLAQRLRHTSNQVVRLLENNSAP